MLKYVIKFAKKGYIKYTSHLDMVKIFERAFKRSSLNLKYSQGFNPHPKLIFAQPLSLGYTSCSEFLEFELKEETSLISADRIAQELQNMLPEGFEILKITVLKEGEKPFSNISLAEYRINFPRDLNIKKEDIENFFNLDEIIVKKKKKTRKGRGKRKREMVEVDVKPFINGFNEIVSRGEGIEKLEVGLKCGNDGALNPSLMLQALFNFLELEYRAELFEIERINLK